MTYTIKLYIFVPF